MTSQKAHRDVLTDLVMVYYPQEEKPLRGQKLGSERVLHFRGAFHKASPRLRLKSHNHEKVSKRLSIELYLLTGKLPRESVPRD